MKKFLLMFFLAIGIALMPAIAQADGSDAVVGATVNADGSVTVTSTKDLSNVHVAACVDGEIVITKFDELTDTEFNFTVDGDILVVLAHSGDNTTVDAEALLTLLGGVVNGNSTGAVALDNGHSCEAPKPVSIFLCFNGTIDSFTADTEAELDILVAEYLDTHDGAHQVLSADSECVVEETTTTTTTIVVTTPEPTVITPEPAVVVAAPAPVTPPATLAALPHTGSSSSKLAILGGLLAFIGLSLRRMATLRRHLQA